MKDMKGPNLLSDTVQKKGKKKIVWQKEKNESDEAKERKSKLWK
jgi:hypothetical protein